MDIFGIDYSVRNNKILEILYNVQVLETSPQSEEYEGIYDGFMEAYKPFCKTLSDEQRRMLIEIEGWYGDLENQSSKECYILGFKTAMKLFLDSIKG